MLSLMRLLQLDIEGLTTSAGFLMEYRDYPYPSVRFLIHDPNPVESDSRIIRHVISHYLLN